MHPQFAQCAAGFHAAFVAIALCAALTACGRGGGGTPPAPAGSRGTPAPASGTPAPVAGVSAPAPAPAPDGATPPAQPTTAGDAVRFLEQSSFGPTSASITEVMQKGPALALEEQFGKPMSGYGTFVDIAADPNEGCPERRGGYLLSRQLHCVSAAGEILPERAECF
jgi:hypothetical protein